MPVQQLLKTLRGRRLLAWETVRKRLLACESLKGLNVVWRLPENTDYDNEPPVDKVCIRLMPKCGPSERLACLGAGRVLSLKPLTITYEISTPGGKEGLTECWENVERVNEAIERELTGFGLQDADLLAFNRDLAENGVDDLEIVVPADWDQSGVISLTIYEEG